MSRYARFFILIIVLLLPGCRPAHLGPGPAAEGAPAVTADTVAAPDSQFNRLFTRFDGGWTGADGTYSVGLGDGRTVWIFGDTFLGRVTPDRTRPVDTPLINNSIVIQAGDSLSTLHGGDPDSPAALVATADETGWYWPADGTLEQGRLRVFYRRFKRTGPDPWQWKWVGTDLASFSLPGLVLKSLLPAAGGKEVMYGSSILETPEYTYIYGTEDRGERKYAHLARAPAGRVAGRWAYFTGSGWHTGPDRSARILEGVANQYSVVPVDSGYLLITMDNRTPFSNLLVAYRAPAPHGPWQGPVPIYAAREAVDDVVAYNAFSHPQFTEDGRLLISYNLNSVSDFSIPYADADSYRPRFIRVDLDRLEALFDGGEGAGKRN